MRQKRSRKARLHRRTVSRPILPYGIYRWEIFLDCGGKWADHLFANEGDEIYELLKSSAAGRWKVIRTTLHSGYNRNVPSRRVVTRILLERDSDAVLVKLRNTDPIFKVFRIVLPGELG